MVGEMGKTVVMWGKMSDGSLHRGNGIGATPVVQWPHHFFCIDSFQYYCLKLGDELQQVMNLPLFRQ